MATTVTMANDTMKTAQSLGTSSSTKTTSTDIYASSASSHISSKKDSFNDSLKQASKKDDKSSSVKNDTKVTKNNDDKKVKDVKEDEEEKDVKESSSDDVNEILANLLNLLNNLTNKSELINNKEVTPDQLKALLEQLNGTSSSEDANKLMEQLLEMLKGDSDSNALDIDSLNSMQDLLKQLSASLDEDDKFSNLKNYIDNLTAKISDMLDQKQGNKVLGLEEMLNKNFSQDSDSLFNEQSDSMLENTDKNSAKEDEFLTKFLGKDEGDSSMAKINMFATRQTVQTQSAQSASNLTVNKLTFADDLIKDVKFMATNSIKELTVKVNPGNLGQITIRLIQEDGVMKANLKANSKETAALLAQNVEQIKSQLSENNVKIAEVNIELYQDDTTFFTQQGFDGQLSEQSNSNNGNSSNSVNGVNGVVDEEIDETVDAIDNRNVNFLA